MKTILRLLVVAAVLLAMPVSAQNASYLDSVYQTLEVATGTDAVTTLKDSINSEYGIVIAEDPNVSNWTLSYVTAIREVLAALPAEFRSATRMIYLDPSFLQYEVKYNGFNDQDGIVQIGNGVMNPSVVFIRRFKELYNRLPTDAELVARFKTILVRGMTYCFLQEKPDIVSSYTRLVAQSRFPTKVYSPGAESSMVVAPGKNQAWTDMAFAVAQYCTAASSLQTNYKSRYDFIKDQVMGGATISNWADKPLTGDSSGNNGNNNGNASGTVETPGTRPPPAIPAGDYMPVVTQVDVGTAAASIPAAQKVAPELLKSAIAELFPELPKFFSTCTEAIAYIPTTDTEIAFSSEGYVFVTQNSWFAPSFVELDDAARGKRFKFTLMREMTLRFLFFHPEVTTKWKTAFGATQSTFDAYVDITQAVVAYYSMPAYLKQLNAERYAFVKENIMAGKEFTP